MPSIRRRQRTQKVDALPPRTTVTIGSSPQLGGTQQQVFVTSATSIALTTADATSGVDSLSYRVFPPGSMPPAYTVVSGSTASLRLQGIDGPYELDTFGTDKAGNTESTQVQMVYLDNTPPTITGAATSSPNAQDRDNAPVTVHFTCGDALSGGCLLLGRHDAQHRRSQAEREWHSRGASGQHRHGHGGQDQCRPDATSPDGPGRHHGRCHEPRGGSGDLLKEGIANSLDSKLAAAQAAQGVAGAGDRATACNQLGAFSSEVQAQTGKVLTADQTTQLLGAATRIRAVLACS